jgi:hypothetical protein
MQHLEVDEEILSVRNIAVQKNQYLGLGKSIFLKQYREPLLTQIHIVSQIVQLF